MLFCIHAPLFAPTAPPLSGNVPFLLQIYSRIMDSAAARCNQRKSTVVTVISNPPILACSTKPLIEHLKTGDGTILGRLTCGSP